MKPYLFFPSIVLIFLMIGGPAGAQSAMTPEMLWKLGRLNSIGVSKDGKHILYDVGTPNIQENKIKHEMFSIPIMGGSAIQVFNQDSLVKNKNISPDGKYILLTRDIKLLNVTGNDLYPDLTKSNAYIFDDLNYRHWDQWNTGSFQHVFFAPFVNGKPGQGKDIMQGEPYDCPQKPFGGDEDYIWSPDSKNILYVCKKKFGKQYALSTNTDIYNYNIETGKTTNLTSGMMGYDVNPSYNSQGKLAWLSMQREGFEADKQDLYIMSGNSKINVTGKRDDLHLNGFRWSNDGSKIYFWAAVKATEQLFEVKDLTTIPQVRQITNGEFQLDGVVAESGNSLICRIIDINHAPELFTVDIANGNVKQLTHVNDNLYNSILSCKAERRSVKTSDGLQMPTWIIYPPNFDPNKKYPTLLFCLGGPQGNTPLYSFRWNFQLIASQGYIVVAPDRRGVFGNGTKWSQEISRDWGGLAMKDYLAAIDQVSKEKYVDIKRRGCVGASYGGYSVYQLEGIHEGRFKTFISHDGLFDFRSWVGTTEELWFANWDIGLPFWDKKNKKSYEQFSPSNFVEKWNTPILIIQGGKDFRVPIEQGLQAFQAAQLKGIKSRLLYLPDENHWVLSAQNAMVWQHEFFKWLDETLK